MDCIDEIRASLAKLEEITLNAPACDLQEALMLLFKLFSARDHERGCLVRLSVRIVELADDIMNEIPASVVAPGPRWCLDNAACVQQECLSILQSLCELHIGGFTDEMILFKLKLA